MCENLSLKGLEMASELGKELGHPGNDIKPCLAALLETSLAKGNIPQRNAAAVALASELRRIGLSEDSAERRLLLWNDANQPPLRHSEIRSALRTAYRREYRYSCRHQVLQSFCVGHDICPFAQRVVGNDALKNDLKFQDYGWQRLLSNRQVLIYSVALPYLEKKRQVGRGGLVCASHKQIADACGIRPERIGNDMRLLQAVGLIDYNVGRPQKWAGIASETRRVLPIPFPTRPEIELLKKRKNAYRRNEKTQDIKRVSKTDIAGVKSGGDV